MSTYLDKEINKIIADMNKLELNNKSIKNLQDDIKLIDERKIIELQERENSYKEFYLAQEVKYKKLFEDLTNKIK